MKAAEFDKAVQIALSDEDLSEWDDAPLYGCALPGFQAVRVPVKAVAKLIRWQTFYIYYKEGQPKYDGEELESLRRLLVYPKRIVEIIDV